MTEQPPSAELAPIDDAGRLSTEALQIALRMPFAHSKDRRVQLVAREIDALCAQRVSAETERCALAARGGDHSECGHGDGYMDGRLDAEAAIRAPAERPAPEPSNPLIPMAEHNVAVAADAYCRSLNSLGRHDSVMLHILEDALCERDRIYAQPIAERPAPESAYELCARWHDEQYRDLRDNPTGSEGLVTGIAGAHMAAHRESAEHHRALASSVPSALASTGEQPDCGDRERFAKALIEIALGHEKLT